MTDPWLPPPAHPYGAPAQPYASPSAQPSAPAQPFPPPHLPSGQAYPSPFPVAQPPGPQPAVRQGPSRTAVAGLVVGSVALLGVIGTALAPLLLVGTMMGFEDAAFEDMGMGEYELTGTLPQASPGRTYTGEEVLAEVERVIEADYSTHRGVECRELDFAVEAEATCTGTVDGMDTDLLVVVEDDLGHFTLVQSW